MIVDGHPVHRSRRVAAWLEKHADDIVMHRLPDYSPDPRADEVLNQDVKSNALGRRRPREINQLTKGMRGRLRATQRRLQIVTNYFKHPSVAYAA